MLVLSRKLNQAIMVGDNVRIVVVSVDRDQVKLGIEHGAVWQPRERITLQRRNVDMHQYGMPFADEFERRNQDLKPMVQSIEGTSVGRDK